MSVRLLLFCIAVLNANAAYATGFDFYKLALSWSPTYCQMEAPQKNRNTDQQCNTTQPYRFIVHGLWPQYGENQHPSFCASPAIGPSQQLIGHYSDVVPDSGLILHQWRKHGTCTGLSAEAYFATMKKAYDQLKIPAIFSTLKTELTVSAQDIKTHFMQANPGLATDMIHLSCRGRKLRDVRICMDKSLSFIPCVNDRDMCPKHGIDIPAPRN